MGRHQQILSKGQTFENNELNYAFGTKLGVTVNRQQICVLLLTLIFVIVFD